MKKQITSIALLLLILAMSLALAPFSSWRAIAGLERISIGVSSSENSALISIAEGEGLFHKYGIEPVFRKYEHGYPALMGLVQGEIDVAVASEFAFVNGSLENEELRILATIATAEGLDLIVRKGIKTGLPSDLKGKRIGLTSNSAGEFCLMMFLASHLISIQDVTVVDLSPPEIVNAFVRGDIDAAITDYIFTSEIQKRAGSDAVIWPDNIGGGFYWLLVGTKGLVDSRSALVEKFLRALVEAEELAGAHKSEMQMLLSKRWNYDLTYLQSIWNKYKFCVVLEQSLLMALEAEARWKTKTPISKQSSIPNYLNFIYWEGLYSVNRRAVTIFR